MTKTIRKVKTYITENDFLKLKKSEPFETYRQMAKNCLSGDCYIYTDKKGKVSIQDVVPKLNEGTKTILFPPLEVLTPDGYKKVQSTVYGKTSTWIEIELERGEVFKMTPDHICVVERNGFPFSLYIPAESLGDEDRFITSDKKTVSIFSIKRIDLAEPEEYFCVNVADPHLFLISTKDSDVKYITHNCNFGLIFGMSAVTFSSTSLETQWSESRIREFIRQRDLSGEVSNQYERALKAGKPELAEYYAVADFLRKEFFNMYQGLKARIERTTMEGMTAGFIRSIFGGIRRVPLLHEMMRGLDSDRKDEANWKNICANTAIQNMEAVKVIAKGIVSFETWSRENNMKSHIIGTVHDSVDFIIFEDEMLPVLKAIVTCFETDERWQKGVALPVELTIADLDKDSNYYKKGKRIDHLKEYVAQLEGSK